MKAKRWSTSNGAIGAALGRLRHGRFSPLGQNSRFFPSNREFRRFCSRNRCLAEKTVRQIKLLPANSRTSANREFAPAQPGIKLAEPRIIAENVRVPHRPMTAEHQKRTRKRPISASSKCDKTEIMLPRNLVFYETDQQRDREKWSPSGDCRFTLRRASSRPPAPPGFVNLMNGSEH